MLKCILLNNVLIATSVPNFRIGSGSDQPKIRTQPDPIRIRKKLSRDPVIRSRRSFFCWIELVVLVTTKKKIAEIGPVDREIIAKNDFSTPDQSWLRRITDRSVRNTIQ